MEGSSKILHWFVERNQDYFDFVKNLNDQSINEEITNEKERLSVFSGSSAHEASSLQVLRYRQGFPLLRRFRQQDHSSQGCAEMLSAHERAAPGGHKGT